MANRFCIPARQKSRSRSWGRPAKKCFSSKYFSCCYWCFCIILSGIATHLSRVDLVIEKRLNIHTGFAPVAFHTTHYLRTPYLVSRSGLRLGAYRNKLRLGNSSHQIWMTKAIHRMWKMLSVNWLFSLSLSNHFAKGNRRWGARISSAWQRDRQYWLLFPFNSSAISAGQLISRRRGEAIRISIATPLRSMNVTSEKSRRTSGLARSHFKHSCSNTVTHSDTIRPSTLSVIESALSEISVIRSTHFLHLLLLFISRKLHSKNKKAIQSAL